MDNSTLVCCLICHSARLKAFPGYSDLPRITSDCRPFPAGGDLAQCMECGAVQKFPNARWLAEIDRIYSSYRAYYQGDGSEQLSFDRVAGTLRPRSSILVDRLIERYLLPSSGALLDVGCGSGVTLRAFFEQRPQWALEGYELGEGNIDKLHAMPRFRELHTGRIGAIPSRYELVSMVHALEHFPNPMSTLAEVRQLLKEKGLLFIEVCNIEQNPFDILVADHLIHFSPAALAAALKRAGLDPLAITTDWIGKEISAVAAASHRIQVTELPAPGTTNCGWAQLDVTLAWLKQFVEAAREVAVHNPRFGIFGTSIAGTWLASQLGEKVTFFVDEDQSRIGRAHLDKPILSPDNLPPGSAVYLALTPAVARTVHERLLCNKVVRWFLPPEEPLLS